MLLTESKITLLIAPNIQLQQVLKALGILNPSLPRISGKCISGMIYHFDRTLNFRIMTSSAYPKCLYLHVKRTDADPDKTGEVSSLGYIHTEKLDIILGRNNCNSICYNTKAKISV